MPIRNANNLQFNVFWTWMIWVAIFPTAKSYLTRQFVYNFFFKWTLDANQISFLTWRQSKSYAKCCCSAIWLYFPHFICCLQLLLSLHHDEWFNEYNGYFILHFVLVKPSSFFLFCAFDTRFINWIKHRACYVIFCVREPVCGVHKLPHITSFFGFGHSCFQENKNYNGASEKTIIKLFKCIRIDRLLMLIRLNGNEKKKITINTAIKN